MLVISAYPGRIDRTTRETALERNRFILALASELVIPHLSSAGGLATLLSQQEGALADLVRVRINRGGEATPGRAQPFDKL